ncbi:MAG TPA: carbon-nitrogen hydrolase family protein [Bacillota bacterium]|nr:carbon-nitrogen hydrolase family protein [Bacillota bacterium]
MPEIHVALAQSRAALADPDRNTVRICQTMREAVAGDPALRLIVFPELDLTGYECGARFADLAVMPEESKHISHIRETAANLGINVIFGYPEKANGKLYNSLLVVDGRGEILGNHRKVHLIPPEIPYFTRGDCYTLCQTDIGKLGLLNCWDTAFPEPARLLAEAGADFLVACAAWEQPYVEQWVLSVRSRAFDNGLPVVGVNRVGPEVTLDFCGTSLVADAMGSVVQRATFDQEQLLYCRIELDVSLRLREKFASQILELQKHTYSLQRIIYPDAAEGGLR